ncbi:MAG: oligosaccharide flippase family protein [Sphingomonas phyllosphaerae]|uniref:lipopolysaccharide biosynthesis protein n=1 Tax=Sphingomonas phyllosphaerae TaxID=257003 RepID=UPI002FFC9D75
MPRAVGFSILADLISLFVGRIGGIFVTLLFIPIYSRLLGPEQFGAVAIILSLQAFFLMSDLGLATLISRDTAVARDYRPALHAVVWMRRRAEAILFALATVAAFIALLLPLAWPVWSIDAGMRITLIAYLIALLVATNIIQLSLNSLDLYRVGAIVAVVGAVARGIATIALLRAVPSVSAFLEAQVAVAAVHFAIARKLLERRAALGLVAERLFDMSAIRRLGKRCAPLVLYTLGGAAAVNLDKSIISAFISLKVAGTYFLATTYALVPVGILSGPINSYFAPKVAHAQHVGDPVSEFRLSLMFQLILMCIVVGPSLSLAFQMSDWLMLWLHDPVQVRKVMIIAPVLLAGGALSATGYYPTSYLIAREDNGYLARLSTGAAIGVLIAAPIFAAQENLLGVAWSYFIFYAVGFTGLWLRLGHRVGWLTVCRFLAIAYLMPLAVISLSYFPLYRFATARELSTPLRLLGPMAVATIAGLLACTAALFKADNRLSATEPKEPT